LFEDVDFVTRIKRRGRFAVATSCVTISARRWVAHGVWRTTFLMYALRAGFYAGISPVTLKRWFVDVRSQDGKPRMKGQSASDGEQTR